MRWPRFSRPRASEQHRHTSASSSDTTPTPDEQITKSPQLNDPGLARLFSDAALFGRILTAPPDLVEDELVAVDDGAVHDTLNSFSRLVAHDLDDNELAVSEKLAQLSVSNWAPAESATLAPRVDPDESDDSASEDENDKTSPGVATRAAREPNFEDKLTPDEILDLLQQDFGALAPPGEEKLLLEADATLFQDVVILACHSSEICPSSMLTTNTGGDAPYHTSPHIPRIAVVVSTQPPYLEGWPGFCTPQRAAPQEESLAPVDTRHNQHVSFKSRRGQNQTFKKYIM